MKHIKHIILTSLIALIGFAMIPLAAVPVGAIDVFKDGCGASQTGTQNASTGTAGTAAGATSTGTSSGQSSICGAATDAKETAPNIVKNVINAALVVLGMIAVVMIVIGGIRYTTSNGDASSIKGAKDTILYAVVGLVIAIMAFPIVNFVLDRFSK